MSPCMWSLKSGIRVLVLVVSALLGNAPAAAATPVPGSYYALTAGHSGKCLDVQAPNTADASKIGQWACNGYPWQSWQLQETGQDAGSGYYHLVSRNSGKCLDVSGVSTADGAQVIQWPCSTGTNQQWQLVAAGTGYQLRARHSGKCAGVAGSSATDGALVQQQTCTSVASQAWTLNPLPAPGTARNPALAGLYADPHAALLDNTFYIYPTTDGIAGWGATSFKAFSSPNLVDWTDRGVVLDLANVSWCHANAWAPAVVQRGSTYYLYFSACQSIGVAASSSPTGPFVDLKGSALVTPGQYGGQSIDPMVFTDTDGQAYLYFGQGQLNAVKLNDDMASFSGTPVNIKPAGSSYNEGTFVFKRNGVYYFMWSENDTRSEDYRVAYGTAFSPLGPITTRGVILSKNTSLAIRGTGHHSVLTTGSGDSYIVYHRFAIPGGDGTHRETCIDRLEFNADGTIIAVTPTLTGIAAPVVP